MLTNKKAVIFDLDGTLIDSMWIWKDIDILFLKERGFSLPSSLQDEIEGMSFTETATYFKSYFNLIESVGELKEIWNKMAYTYYETSIPLKPSVLPFLAYLKTNHYKLGIATSNSKELVAVALKAHNITSYFDCIRTSCEVNKGKPAPDIYLEVAKQLNVTPDECIVFEDVPMGILAGKNANMEVCAVYDEFSILQDPLKKQYADYYIHTYDAILEKTYEVLK